MQVRFSDTIDLVPFTIDDIHREQVSIRDQMDTLRKGFFARYGEWIKENKALKETIESLKKELEFIKGSKIFLEQEETLFSIEIKSSTTLT